MRRMQGMLCGVVFVLLFNSGLFAQNTCSSATITGKYAYLVSGFADYVNRGNGPFAPTTSLGTAVLKPTGGNSASVSIAWTQSLGNWTPKLTGSGTATINDDCTGSGTFKIHELNEFAISFEFVVLDEGKEIRMMPVSPSGLAVSAEFRRMSNSTAK